jgi:hypothetical protein
MLVGGSVVMQALAGSVCLCFGYEIMVLWDRTMIDFFLLILMW